MSMTAAERLQEFKSLLESLGPSRAGRVRVLRFFTTLAKTNAAGMIESVPVVQVVYTIDQGDKQDSFTEYLPLNPANDNLMTGSKLWPIVEPMLSPTTGGLRAELMHRSGSF